MIILPRYLRRLLGEEGLREVCMVTVAPQVDYSQHLSPGLVCLSLDDF